MPACRSFLDLRSFSVEGSEGWSHVSRDYFFSCIDYVKVITFTSGYK